MGAEGITPAGEKVFSRRQFVRYAGVTATSLAIPTLLTKSESHVRPDQLLILPELPGITIGMIDFAPLDPSASTPYFHQDRFVNREEVYRKHLGKDYMRPWKRAGLAAWYETRHALGRGESMEKEFLKANPRMALFIGAIRQFSDHGRGVAHVLRHEAAKRGGVIVKPYILPVEDLFGPVKFETDDYGNPGMTLNIDLEKFKAALKEFPHLDTFNFSLQLGDITFFQLLRGHGPGGESVDFDPPQTRIVGAFSRPRAENSLQQLNDAAKTMPETVFSAAAGNYQDDLRQAMLQLADDMEPTVILSAQWGQGRPQENIDGAPVYTRKDAYWNGSSVSTGITTIASAFSRYRRVRPENIPGLITRDFTEKIVYESEDPDTGKTKEAARVYEPLKMQSTLYLRDLR